MLIAVQILKTADGSYTLFNEDLNETYHSVQGALGESNHVYIENGLKQMPSDRPFINILEIGFGTGMNALLSIDHKNPQQGINYFTLEPFPLDIALLNQYYQGFEKQPKSIDLLNSLSDFDHPGKRKINIGFNFIPIKKRLQDLKPSDLELDGSMCKADLVYYDAFAPSRQSEMWDMDTLEKLASYMSRNARLVTYCAQGQFKRNLKTLGFTLLPARGAHGKREMTVAIKS